MSVQKDDPFLKEILERNKATANSDADDVTKRYEMKAVKAKQFNKVLFYMIAVFFVMLITVALLYYNSFTVASLRNTRQKKSENIKYGNESDAYFTAKGDNFNGMGLAGKVDYALDVGNNDQVKYKLVNANEATIVYLVSSNNDLSILVGLNVVLKGKSTRNKINSKEIVDVESIQLK